MAAELSRCRQSGFLNTGVTNHINNDCIPAPGSWYCACWLTGMADETYQLNRAIVSVIGDTRALDILVLVRIE